MSRWRKKSANTDQHNRCWIVDEYSVESHLGSVLLLTSTPLRKVKKASIYTLLLPHPTQFSSEARDTFGPFIPPNPVKPTPTRRKHFYSKPHITTFLFLTKYSNFDIVNQRYSANNRPKSNDSTFHRSSHLSHLLWTLQAVTYSEHLVSSHRYHA